MILIVSALDFSHLFLIPSQELENLKCVLIRSADGETERQTDRGRDSKTALINRPSGSACLFHPSGGKIPSDLTPIIPLFSLSTSFLPSPPSLFLSPPSHESFSIYHIILLNECFPALKTACRARFSLSAWTLRFSNF